MIIQSSSLAMNSSRNSYTSFSKSSSISASSATITVRNALSTNKNSSSLTGTLPEKDNATASETETEESATLFSDVLEDEAMENMTNSMLGRSSLVSGNVLTQSYKEAMESIRMQCINYLIALFFGTDSDKYREYINEMNTEDSVDSALHSSQFQNTSNTTMYQVFTVEQTTTSFYTESESTDFSVGGTVINSDGTEIPINLSVSMSRSFTQMTQSSTTMSSYTMMDPLVINLDTNIAGLSDQKFEFDLDQDGILDTISSLNSGSGYLALDKNQDGYINDGSELFGTASGDGFSDLAKYDEDGNGWIDEADDIFDKLLIWSRDESGNDKLYHLTEKGVGAICLSNVSTDFSLNSVKDNVTNGAVRSSGVFLYENGTCGTLQQVDLAAKKVYSA